MNKEDIKTSFKLPIEYRATTNINDNISNDLELLNTIDSSNIPIYKYLFSPNPNIPCSSIPIFKFSGEINAPAI